MQQKRAAVVVLKRSSGMRDRMPREYDRKEYHAQFIKRTNTRRNCCKKVDTETYSHIEYVTRDEGTHLLDKLVAPSSSNLWEARRLNQRHRPHGALEVNECEQVIVWLRDLRSGHRHPHLF